MPVENGLAVVADRFWRAKEMAAVLPIVWDEGPAAETDSEKFRADYRAALDGPLVNAVKRGDAAGALAARRKSLKRSMRCPHLAHAPMEPLNATVDWRPDRIDAWIGTQSPDAALQLAAEAGGVDPGNVFIHNCYLGGGFGRRAVNDELRQAVQVSKAVGKPVKLVWTREQDIQHDRYRPQAALRLKAGLGADGMPRAFDFRTAVGSITRSLGWGSALQRRRAERGRGARPTCPIARDALNVDCAAEEHACAGHVLALGRLFAERLRGRELHRRTARMPRARIRSIIGASCSPAEPDFLAVLDKLADKGEWGRPLPAGTARGIAIHESFGTIVGEIVEVAVSKSGEVKVERVVACVDCGHVVNPLNVRDADRERGALWPDRGFVRRDHDQERRGRAEQFRRLPDRPHGRRAQRSKPISRCRAAANGAASANPARRRSRPPSPMRFSPSPANASARCR